MPVPRRSKSKSINKVIGIALMTVGAGLAVWGYQKSGGFESQLSNVLTGSHSDQVMMLYIGGAVSAVLGVYLIFKR